MLDTKKKVFNCRACVNCKRSDEKKGKNNQFTVQMDREILTSNILYNLVFDEMELFFLEVQKKGGRECNYIKQMHGVRYEMNCYKSAVRVFIASVYFILEYYKQCMPI